MQPKSDSSPALGQLSVKHGCDIHTHGMGDWRGPTRSRCVRSGCQIRAGAVLSSTGGPKVCGVQEVLRAATYASGFRCDLVSDAEGSRPLMTELSCGPAPLGRLGCARRCRRFGVRNTRIQPCSETHSAQCRLQSGTLIALLRFGKMSLALALPKVSIKSAAQCCDMRPVSKLNGV